MGKQTEKDEEQGRKEKPVEKARRGKQTRLNDYFPAQEDQLAEKVEEINSEDERLFMQANLSDGTAKLGTYDSSVLEKFKPQEVTGISLSADRSLVYVAKFVHRKQKKEKTLLCSRKELAALQLKFACKFRYKFLEQHMARHT